MDTRISKKTAIWNGIYWNWKYKIRNASISLCYLVLNVKAVKLTHSSEIQLFRNFIYVLVIYDEYLEKIIYKCYKVKSISKSINKVMLFAEFCQTNKIPVNLQTLQPSWNTEKVH